MVDKQYLGGLQDLTFPTDDLQKVVLPTVFLVVLVSLWSVYIRVADVSPILLPGPYDVVVGVVRVGLGPNLVTLQTILGGYLIGGLVGYTVGLVMGTSHRAFITIAPYAFMSRAVPIIAVAPAIILILGGKLSTNMFITAILVFFPIVINTARGFRDIDPVYDLFRKSVRMNRWQYFKIIEFRKSLRSVFTGLKLGITLATIGSIVSEYINPMDGLGQIVLSGRGEIFGTTLMFSGVLCITIIGSSLYVLVIFIEKRTITWQ